MRPSHDALVWEDYYFCFTKRDAEAYMVELVTHVSDIARATFQESGLLDPWIFWWLILGWPRCKFMAFLTYQSSELGPGLWSRLALQDRNMILRLLLTLHHFCDGLLIQSYEEPLKTAGGLCFLPHLASPCVWTDAGSYFLKLQTAFTCCTLPPIVGKRKPGLLVPNSVPLYVCSGLFEQPQVKWYHLMSSDEENLISAQWQRILESPFHSTIG